MRLESMEGGCVAVIERRKRKDLKREAKAVKVRH